MFLPKKNSGMWMPSGKIFGSASICAFGSYGTHLRSQSKQL